MTPSLKRINRKSHSGTVSSKEVCSYLTIIAAYHALPRILKPSHPHNRLNFYLNHKHSSRNVKTTIFNLIKNQMVFSVLHHKTKFCSCTQMDPPGFEPGTPALQGRCSTGLSHRPIHKTTTPLLAAYYKIM